MRDDFYSVNALMAQLQDLCKKRTELEQRIRRCEKNRMILGRDGQAIHLNEVRGRYSLAEDAQQTEQGALARQLRAVESEIAGVEAQMRCIRAPFPYGRDEYSPCPRVVDSLGPTLGPSASLEGPMRCGLGPELEGLLSLDFHGDHGSGPMGQVR